MNPNDSDLLHSWAVTTWSKVFRARGDDDAAQQARNELVVRYHEVVYQYFLKRLRDPNVAAELYSNFALRLLDSNALVQGADPRRGRFRNYLKKCLSNMVIDHYRQQGRGRKVLPLTVDVEEAERDDFSPLFSQELLNQAWKALEATAGDLFAVLRCQSDHPQLRSQEIAERLGPRLSKQMTAEGVRKSLQRAREAFGQLLLDEVARSMQRPSVEELERELIELQLLPFCKKALEKRRQVEG